jgi:hypothetical protein
MNLLRLTLILFLSMLLLFTSKISAPSNTPAAAAQTGCSVPKLNISMS